MSESHKNIDPFYKENFENFKVSPPDHLWEKIEAELPQKKKKRSVLVWLLPVGIAASLVLFFGLYFNNSIIEEPIPVTEAPANTEDICPEDQFSEPTQNASTNSKIKNEVDLLTGNPKKPITIQSKSEEDYNSAYANNSALKNKENSIQSNNIPVSGNKFTRPSNTNFSENAISEKTLQNKKISFPKNNKSTIIHKLPIEESTKKESLISESNNIELKRIENPVIEEKTIKDQITQSEDLKVEEKETKKTSKNWSIQPQLAPLIYNSFSKGSPIAQNFADNDQSTSADLSYGVKIAYQFSNKLSVRTGISTASVNIITNEVGVSTTNTGTESFGSLDGIAGITDLNSPNNPVNNGGGLGVNSKPPPNSLIPDKTNGNVPLFDDNTVDGSLVQDLNYIEIPLELAYQLINKKIGLQLIGGMSTFLLNKDDDQVIFRSDNQEDTQGTINNLNRTSFSGNFGVGLDYNIAPNFKISVEPVLKVQFNAFNDNTDFNPYIFGIYSGIKFRL